MLIGGGGEQKTLRLVARHADAYDEFLQRFCPLEDGKASDRAIDAVGVDARRPVYKPLHHHTGQACPHAEAAYRTGRALQLLERWDDAQRSFLRVLDVDPGHPDALLAGTEPARIFRSEDGGRRAFGRIARPSRRRS